MLSLIRPFFVSAAPTKVIIIGAGVAGMAAAAVLKRLGVEYVVLEKSNHAGGRMDTRRLDGGIFDTGAQFTLATDQRFQNVLDQWKGLGLIREWSRGFMHEDGLIPNDRYARYRALQGMGKIAEHMSQGLNILYNTEAAKLLWRGSTWEVRTPDDTEYEAEGIIITLPVPEARRLLESGNYEIPDVPKGTVEQLTYDPCLALLVTSTEQGNLPKPGAIKLDGEPLAWIADNHRKGISPGAYAFTIHGGAQFSRTHFEANDATITRKMLEAAKPWIPGPARATEIVRWRHSTPRHTMEEPHLVVSSEPPLVLAGDAFASGGGVQAAFLSGMTAGEFMAAERRSLIADLIGL